jgi:hypothetical protein
VVDGRSEAAASVGLRQPAACGVLRLELSDKILENVSASGRTLPSTSNITKLLHGTTVVYTHVLNTNTWMLRPIARSVDDMVCQILPAV